MYINDLIGLLGREGFKCYFYADDFAVLTHGEQEIIRLAKLVDDWCRDNLMSINKNKCGILFIAGRNSFSKFETTKKKIADIPIVDSYKYLGITLKKTLTPNYHIEKVTEKLEKFRKMQYILYF